MKKAKNILLAISGGPDSMVLLHKFRKNKNIVVAHVNYNFRKESGKEQKLVEETCKKYGVSCEVLAHNGKKPEKNFQDWARKIRYDFFEKIYKKYNCVKLVIAHHKDDFLETALMQSHSKRTPYYFGIKEKNELQGMTIYRPFVLTKWKEDLRKIIDKNAIEYGVDRTNFEPIYTRNKIRLEIKNWSKKEKRSRFEWYTLSNRILEKKHHRVQYLFTKWSKTNFSASWFRENPRYQIELVYEYVYHFFKGVKLSTSKMESISEFITGQEGNRYFVLNTNNKIYKKTGHIHPISTKK